MTEHFPLYESMITNIPHKDLVAKEKQEFMRLLADINPFGIECIYALIHYYYINHETNTDNQFPYGCSIDTSMTGKSNVSWNLNELPNKLKQMLLKFVRKHTESNKQII